MTKRYSHSFKARMVQRMAGPKGMSATALSKEIGICQPTLSQWLREASEDRVSGMKRKRPRDWSPEEKLTAVVEAARLDDEELGAFLRRQGLYEAQLDEWRTTMLGALEKAPQRKAKVSAEARRVRDLEKELDRKEKALAEAAALLILKKKAQAIWGDGDADTPLRSAR